MKYPASRVSFNLPPRDRIRKVKGDSARRVNMKAFRNVSSKGSIALIITVLYRKGGKTE